ncbi:hypothetical protein MMC30_005537 [Trapelia coarctata]|nr:hypothetical protein [Trapelia coarctata]
MDDGLLTGDRIDELLLRAEAHLKGLVAVQDSPRSSISRIASGMPLSVSKLDPGTVVSPYVTLKVDIARADPGRLVPERERLLSGKIRKVDDPMEIKRKSLESKKTTAGSDWFNLPRTNLTPELKRDLQLLKMRSVLDPKRHYKKDNGKAVAPEFSQAGTIIDGPTDFYSSRLQNRERKRTLVEEVMQGEGSTGRFKNKYNEVQLAKTSGKKAHYKALKAKRTKSIRR